MEREGGQQKTGKLWYVDYIVTRVAKQRAFPNIFCVRVIRKMNKGIIF